MNSVTNSGMSVFMIVSLADYQQDVKTGWTFHFSGPLKVVDLKAWKENQATGFELTKFILKRRVATNNNSNSAASLSRLNSETPRKLPR